MPDPSPRKLLVFVDTNVLLSAFATEGVSAQLWHRAEDGDFDPVVSEQVVREFAQHEARVIGFPPEKRERTLDLILRVCEVVRTPRHVPEVCRDRDDDVILAAAVEAKVDVLVTGDDDLLVLESHEGIPIVRPAELLRRLGKKT